MAPDGLTSQEVALAIIPHVTGGLSMMGSAFIAISVLRSANKRRKTYHRLLLAMSISDFVSSFFYFLSTWPIPQGPVGGWDKYGGSPYHYAAVGTEASCTTQGWGIQFGTMTTATYNVMLAIHYLLVVRWNFGEYKLKKTVEPWMLSIPPIVGLGLSLPQIFLKYYNDTNLWCWIKASWEYEDAVKRSYDARWAFAYGPLWAFIAFITLAQIYLWWTVRQIEKRVQRFRSFDVARHQTSQSRSVAKQAALYVVVFYVTNLPYTSIAATQRFYNPHTTGGFCALLAVVICAPFQGFLNLFVYRRHQIISTTKDLSGKASNVINRTKRTSAIKARNANASPDGLDIEEANEAENGGAEDDEGVLAKDEECDLLLSKITEVYDD